MRIVQSVILKLLGLLVLIGSALLISMWFNEDVYVQVLQDGKALFHTLYGPVIGIVLFLVAFVGIVPVCRAKRPRSTISFPGIRGDVTIELDSVEANLSRVVSKMPEVKKIKVKVVPSEDNRRAVVSADVLMYKGSGGASAHETANRISEFLMDAAVNILGVEEVTKVNLNVRDIIVDAKQLAAAHARETLPKLEEPAAAVSEPPAKAGDSGAVSSLALGAFGSGAEEKSLGRADYGFSSTVEVIPAAPARAEAVGDSPILPESGPAAENTGFQALTNEDDEAGKKETDSGSKFREG